MLYNLSFSSSFQTDISSKYFSFKLKLCISGPDPCPKSSPAASASDMYSFAFLTESGTLNPFARFAAIALDNVHPVP